MRKRIYSVLLLGSFLWAPCGAFAANPTDNALPDGQFHQIEGFRGARFGDSMDDVRTAIMKDFGVAEDAIENGTQPIDGNQVLSVAPEHLEPGLGNVLVRYVFGYESQTLMQVLISWELHSPPVSTQVEFIAKAGVKLSDYFKQLRWKEGKAQRISFPFENAITLFRAEDPQGRKLHLYYTGVNVEDEDEQRQWASSPRQNVPYLFRFSGTIEGGAESGYAVSYQGDNGMPLRLHLEYAVDAGKLDVYDIQQGDF